MTIHDTSAYPQASGFAQGVPHTPHTQPAHPTWREERRADRLAQAAIDRDDRRAESQARIAEAAAAQSLKESAQEAKAKRREAASLARAKSRKALGEWCRSHTVDLMFVPVITVPAGLAWTGMADYGFHDYGLPGLALPALSEGGMWAFAAATTLRRREDERRLEEDPLAGPRPLWHYRLGTVAFAALGAALNFLHGFTEGGPAEGVTMALVSVAGVTAHQLITAGPRRSRAERHQARLARAVARRERRASSAAVRTASVEMDESGKACLVFEPGAARLERKWGRTRLVRELAGDWPAARTAPEAVRPEGDDAGAPVRPGEPQPVPGTVPGSAQDASREPVREAQLAPVQPVRPTGAQVREELAEIVAARPPQPRLRRVRALPLVPGDAGEEALLDGGGALAAGWEDQDKEERRLSLLASRDALVAEWARQFADAIASGDRWVPDYDRLIADTGVSKSWLEKAAKAARDRALGGGEPDGDASRTAGDRMPGRTENGRTGQPHGASRTGSDRTEGDRTGSDRTEEPDGGGDVQLELDVVPA